MGLSYVRDVTQYGPTCRTVLLSFGAIVTLLQSAAHIAITRQPCTTTAPSWVGFELCQGRDTVRSSTCRTVLLSFGPVVTLLQSAAHIAITRQPCTTTAPSWGGFELCQGRDTVWAHLPHCPFVIWGCSDIVAERRAHCDHAAALHHDRSELGWTLSDARDVTQYGPILPHCRFVIWGLQRLIVRASSTFDHAAALHQDRSELGWV